MALKTNKILTIDYGGKMPPQALDMEEAVLGAIIIDGNSIIEIVDILKPENFYKDEHTKIYNAAIELFIKNKKIDAFTLPEELRKRDELDEVGGVAYITQLGTMVASSYNIKDHAVIVKDKFMKREFIRFTTELQNASFDDSNEFEDLKSYAQNELYSILTTNDKKEADRVDWIMYNQINIITKLSVSEIKYTGIPTGYIKIDRLTCGWQETDLIILAARPSIGKTAIAIWFAMNAAMLQIPILFFSLEMSKEQLTRRILSYTTGINGMNFNRGNVDDKDIQKMEDSLNKFSDIPLYIDDTPALSIIEMTARAKKYVIKYGVRFIVCDYLQLMQGDKNGNRENEVSSISRGLKSIAKQNKLPVLALSQLNRQTEVRGKKPQLSDLRESGAIEQDADIVIFIDKPMKRGTEEINISATKTISTKNLIILDIAKYRNGATGEVFMYANKEFIDFREYEDETQWESMHPDQFIEPGYEKEEKPF